MIVSSFQQLRESGWNECKSRGGGAHFPAKTKHLCAMTHDCLLGIQTPPYYHSAIQSQSKATKAEPKWITCSHTQTRGRHHRGGMVRWGKHHTKGREGKARRTTENTFGTCRYRDARPTSPPKPPTRTTLTKTKTKTHEIATCTHNCCATKLPYRTVPLNLPDAD